MRSLTVYRYAFDGNEVRIGSAENNPTPADCNAGILLSCCQLYAEGTEYYYGRSTLCTKKSGHLERLLYSISAEQRSFIQHVRYSYSFWGRDMTDTNRMKVGEKTWRWLDSQGVTMPQGGLKVEFETPNGIKLVIPRPSWKIQVRPESWIVTYDKELKEELE